MAVNYEKAGVNLEAGYEVAYDQIAVNEAAIRPF